MDTDCKRAVLYARVSSDRQDVDLSISAQLKALKEYAVRNGYSIVKEFVDENKNLIREILKLAIAHKVL